jgi:co-chaperonin GroES (HSP10)
MVVDQYSFKPVNRYILIDLAFQEEKTEQLIVLPESYKKPEEKHTTVACLSWADDVRFELNYMDELIIDRKMVEEIKVGRDTFHLILDNYVLGVLKKE